MTPPAAAPTQEAYLAALPVSARARLEAVRAAVERAVPGATRCVAYRMPAWRRGRVFLYAGAFEAHVGIYPPVTDDAALVAALAPYRGPKGNLAFRHDAPLPIGLIERVAAAHSRQYGGD